MAVYRRGGERLLVPHVVSAVERHQRQLTIRVTVRDADGSPLRAHAERDIEADVEAARRGAPPVNADVETFLERAKAVLDPKLLGDDSPYKTTANVRKALEYWWLEPDGGTMRFKVHFGGYSRDIWSPIQVGLYVESRTARERWRARVEEALAAGRLPLGTKVSIAGKQTVAALKEYVWSAPIELTDELLRDVAETLLRFEEVFGARR